MALDPHTTWFTADHHFGHKAVLKYAGRPFETADEMDEALIANHNALVAPGDTVYFVGDLSFRKVDRTYEIVERLHGQKFWAFGNHDDRLRNDVGLLSLFVKAGDLLHTRVADADAHGGVRRIRLFHYAMRVWNGSHHGTWHLYGHSHGNLADDPHALSLDVGVDCWGLRPASYAQIKERMATKDFKPVDHHGRDR